MPKSYTITDEDALYEAAPHLFRSVPQVVKPDHVKIRAALKAGFALPGLEAKGEEEISGKKIEF